MPLYEFECCKGHRFEVYAPMSCSNVEGTWCRGTRILAIERSDCSEKAIRVLSLYNPRPDTNWHKGEFVKGHGYLNSTSKIKRAKKLNNLIELNGIKDIESQKKVADNANKEKDERLTRDTREHFTKAFSEAGILDSFGEIRPEANIQQGDGDIKGTFSVDEFIK